MEEAAKSCSFPLLNLFFNAIIFKINIGEKSPNLLRKMNFDPNEKAFDLISF